MIKKNIITLGFGWTLLVGCSAPTTSSSASTVNNATPAFTNAPTIAPSAVSALEGLPADVKDYSKWLKANSTPIPPDSSAPHSPSQGNKNIFVNQSKDILTPGGQVKYPFPIGTVIVKEALNKEKGYVELVSIMRKIDKLDPEHGNWQFHEYLRSAPDQAFRLAFKDSTCFSCHAVAKERDFIRFPLQLN